MPACSGTPASSLPAEPDSAALEADGQNFVINYGGAPLPYEQWIEVTPELLSAVATVLCSRPVEEYAVDSVSGEEEMDNIMLQGGERHLVFRARLPEGWRLLLVAY